jgi:hypothetical protein
VSRKIHADKRGISPVLGAALTLGVIVTISSTVLAVWVPSEMNRREHNHLQGVERSLRELKATIEYLWVGENRSVDLKMGPEPLPLVPNPKRGGTLSVTPAENVGSDNLENIMKSDLGHIEFDWEDQSWVYESGMIIWVHDNTCSMKSPPGVVTVMQVDNNNFEVHFNIIRIRELEHSVSGTGTSTIAITRLEEMGAGPEDTGNVTIWINSRYEDAWGEYLANEADELGEMGITAVFAENTLTLTIQGGGENIQFYRKVTDIEVNLE